MKILSLYRSSASATIQNEVEGPVQSSHYEDSSDDDEVSCDDGRSLRPGYSRHNSSNTMESGISTSGQVDEGQFRLVPNNVEDERFNQFNPPRSQPEPSASSSSTSSTTSRASTSQNEALRPLFCEPGPSRPRNNGVNNNQQPTASSGSSATPTTGGGGAGRNNGLDFEIDALDNFPASGDYDPTNSLSSSFPPMDSHPVDLEDIQVQNFAPEHFSHHNKNAEASEAASVSSASSGQQSSGHIIPQQSMSKYINNNDMKDDLASSGSLGNISLAFSGLPGKSTHSTSTSDSAEAKAASSSSSNR